ncbi:NmrA family transcriptional regulator [Zopfia rhizophila CBS 207.26]|uniref:NmrA family transcriptional regulator n=1 Tax=Zopfia rhizophila CBS 207.26 TaxID=1314779 RepID=A0A6A6DGC8_9PEZI|nr:NmrA family transcriptional regulator [Zopfia rhizophila CBS 207.26]
MSKVITVFGATGNQGGSVIHILADSALSKTSKVRGVARDPGQPAATKLSLQGVEVVSVSRPRFPESLTGAIKDSHTVFLTTNTVDPATELAQGKNVTDIAKEVGVSHLILTSLLPIKEITNGHLQHVLNFDTKAEIEKYIRQSNVPATFFLPGCFMTNFDKQLQKGPEGSYTLSYPISKESKLPLVDTAEDTGKFVKSIIKNRDTLFGKQVLGATDYYIPEQIVQDIKSVSGRDAKFYQISGEKYKSQLPEFIARRILENFLFFEDPGYFNGANLDESLKILAEKPVT